MWTIIDDLKGTKGLLLAWLHVLGFGQLSRDSSLSASEDQINAGSGYADFNLQKLKREKKKIHIFTIPVKK